MSARHFWLKRIIGTPNRSHARLTVVGLTDSRRQISAIGISRSEIVYLRQHNFHLVERAGENELAARISLSLRGVYFRIAMVRVGRTFAASRSARSKLL